MNENLILDSSFESDLPLIFKSDDCYVSKLEVNDAFHGNIVMVTSGWRMESGSTIKSRLMSLNDSVFSAAVHIRRYGPSDLPTKVSIHLYDESDSNLGAFNSVTLNNDDTWEEIAGMLELPNMIEKGYLSITVQGEHRGIQLQFDNFRLLRGKNHDEPSVNTPFFYFIEAEELAGVNGWETRSRLISWMFEKPSNNWLLSGSTGIATDSNTYTSKKVTINKSGRFRLWVRFFVVNQEVNSGKFSIALHQNGHAVQSKEINEGDTTTYKAVRFNWDYIEAELAAGEISIVVSRPHATKSWVSRKLDCLLLTDDIDYIPKINDLQAKSYFRFINDSDEQAPYCLSVWINRPNRDLGRYLGTLSHRGLINHNYVPGAHSPKNEDIDQWLAEGDKSPWVEVSKELQLGEERQNLHLTATRIWHYPFYVDRASFVQGRIKGRIEFAVGKRRRIVKKIDIDQNAPRVMIAIPFNFSTQIQAINSAMESVDNKLKQCDNMGIVEPHLKTKHIDLSTGLLLTPDVDDLLVLKGEIEVLRKLGMNNTWISLPTPKKAVAFHKDNGLVNRFTRSIRDIWFYALNRREEGVMVKTDQYHPYIDEIDQRLKKYREELEPIVESLQRLDVMDEPGGMAYSQIIDCEQCTTLFRNTLKEMGLSPSDLGVSDWDSVIPVSPAPSGEVHNFPRLFYYTGIFRLKALAHFFKTITASKQKYFGNNGKTTVNYVSIHSGKTWTQFGVDPFFIHRNGGLEMLGTEDWLAWGAGPQHMSYQFALLRAAGNYNQPLWAHLVLSGTINARSKLRVYTALAGGVRQLNYYSYGPSYAAGATRAFDNNFDLYPIISSLNKEISRIDNDLNGTSRRKTDVALLFNRTAAIWEDNASSTSDLNNNLIHWALAHAGYDADFISEEDIDDGRLKKYKVLYISGPQLKQTSAKVIAIWVEQGGYLFGCAGAGSRNEFNEPSITLSEVFGAESEDLQLVHNAGRPKYEVRTQKSLGALEVVSSSIISKIPDFRGFDQLCYSEYLRSLKKGEVFLLKEGQPAGVTNYFGSGFAIRVAGLPGLSYLNEAIRDDDYDPDRYLPQKFNPALRDFIVWPAKLADAEQMAMTSEPIAEIVRYDGSDRSVLFVLDHSIKKHDAFLLKIPDALLFTSAYTATGNPVQLGMEGDLRTILLPLDVADAIVLKR